MSEPDPSETSLGLVWSWMSEPDPSDHWTREEHDRLNELAETHYGVLVSEGSDGRPRFEALDGEPPARTERDCRQPA
jgi:hypothetical protein